MSSPSAVNSQSAKSIYRIHPHPSPIRIDIKNRQTNQTADIEKEVQRILKKKELLRRQRASGVRQVLETNESSVCKKICWILATTACLAASCYFVSQQLLRYRRVPTSLRTEIERSAFINVPGISVCPGLPGLINARARNLLSIACSRSGQENCEEVPFDQLGLSIEDIWNATRIKKDQVQVQVECPFDQLGEFRPCDVPTNWEYFDSFWGSCVSFSPQDKDQFYTGPHGVYNITIELDDDLDKTFHMFLHDINNVLTHYSYFNSRKIISKQVISIGLRPKKFRMLTRNKEKCIDTSETVNCVNNCTDDKLSRVLNCRLPFISTKRQHVCSSWKDAETALKQAAEIYRRTTKLSCEDCGNRCQEILYPMSLNSVGVTGNNSTQLLFYYEDNSWESIEEVLDYPFMSFISEVGGILGFFIGFSVLSLLELIQHMFYSCKKFSKSHCRCLY